MELVPPMIVVPPLTTLNVWEPMPIVALKVTIPAGALNETGALLPLVMVNVAGLVRRVVAKTTSARRFLPLGGPRVSFVHVTAQGVGRYQYTSWSSVTVGVLAPAL